MTTSMCKPLIAVTNRHLCERDFLTQLRRVCAFGVHSILLREKDLSESDYTALAKQAQQICRDTNTPLTIHGHPETARRLGISRLHLPLPQLRQLEDPQSWDWLGTSCHSIEQMQEAVKLGVTYLFLGNIFETDCKPGLPGKGLELLRAVCAQCPVPVFAIGGISLDNLPDVLEAGAAGGCMMSGLMRL
ncbi:MAG: thiamine phosphate synthase [Butyricicoccus sp.]